MLAFGTVILGWYEPTQGKALPMYPMLLNHDLQYPFTDWDTDLLGWIYLVVYYLRSGLP
jgi:hypothetical protein